MTCERRASAAGVAALPEQDPERAEFLAHARGCAGCAEALREGAQLLRLLEAATLPAPSPAALQRAAQPVLADLQAAPGRAELHQAAPGRAHAESRAWRGGTFLRAGAAVLGFAVPVLFARGRDLAGAGAALLVLAAATLLAATAGAVRAGALVALGAAAGFALAAGGVPGLLGFDASSRGLGLAGSECLFLELLSAALPLAAAAWVFRRDPRPGALAQAAAAGALAGQAALHLGCRANHEAAHLWAFHVGAVLAAAAAGWLLEGRLQPAAKSARS